MNLVEKSISLVVNAGIDQYIHLIRKTLKLTISLNSGVAITNPDQADGPGAMVRGLLEQAQR